MSPRCTSFTGEPTSPSSTAAGRMTNSSNGTNQIASPGRYRADSMPPMSTTTPTSVTRSNCSLNPSTAWAMKAGALSGSVATSSAAPAADRAATSGGAPPPECAASTRRSATPAANAARNPYA
jgi:hypothetical protein